MKIIEKILKSEAKSGFLIFMAMIAALVAKNSFASSYYALFLDIPVKIQIGALIVAKPLLLWINDALMAVFFFLVGLELKREILIGELSDKRKLIQPSLAAIFGIVVPALIYVAFNRGDEVALNGWAIPTATDIAFALGALSLLGNRVPKELKILLLSIAIIDDICAIAIIGVFYSGDLSTNMLIISLVSIAILTLLNKRGVNKLTPYIFVGVFLWLSILKSGIHATLAGVILAMFIPLKTSEGDQSLLVKLENDLHSSVAYIILPLFAFANSGLDLSKFSIPSLLEPVPLGIIAGLVLGKQIGVFSGVWIASKVTSMPLAKSITWTHIYGLSALCGIGFTMSLFISGLAFDPSNWELLNSVRIGILSGSFVSAILGYVVLHKCCKREEEVTEKS